MIIKKFNIEVGTKIECNNGHMWLFCQVEIPAYSTQRDYYHFIRPDTAYMVNRMWHYRACGYKTLLKKFPTIDQYIEKDSV